MKNICFVCFDLSVMGGAEKVATDVAAALAQSYNVHMVSLTGEKPLLELDSKVRYTNLGLDLSRLRKGLIPAAKALKGFYKENNIHISFLEGNYTGFVCSLASLFTKTRQVFHDHGSLMSQWDRRDIRTIRRIASKLCDYTMVLTEESMKDYISMFGLKASRVSYIHNWIDKVPEIWEYKSDSKYIMSAGRFALEKQFHTLLPDTAKLVKEKHPDWQWHIYGDGEYLEQTRDKIKELNLQDFVILKGRVSDLEERYQDYSMYVMTSNREGMPLVLLEAKANGLPIAAYDVKTGPSEIVRDGIDGFLLSYGDTAEMAKAVCRLIEDRDLRKDMSLAAYNDVGRFSKGSILKQWTEFIESH